MPATVYQYQLVDFPYARVDTTRLQQEISGSTIAVNLSRVDTYEDKVDCVFADVLVVEDQSTLTGIIQSHSGLPLPDPATVDGVPKVAFGPVSLAGHQIVEVSARSGAKTQIISQNFCDRHTWYATSQRHTGIVLVDSGDGLTWTLPPGTLTHSPPNTPGVPFGLVDVTHGRILHERRLRAAYRTRVYVNGIEKAEKDPHDEAGDWVINYTTGAVTFAVTQAGKTVTLDCSEVVNSKWYVRPGSGKKLRLVSAELQFSTDSRMQDTFVFQPRGDVAKFTGLANYCTTNGGPYPPGTLLPLGDPTCYQTVFDLVCEANLAYPAIPALKGDVPTWRDTKADILIFSWEYGDQATIDVSSGPGWSPNDIEIYLEHDREMVGSYAVVTFYCISEDA